MNPRTENEHLSAWLDGELDEAEAAELEAELARDPELRAELQSLESVVRVLRQDGPLQAPIGFERRLMARIEEEHPNRASWWGWMRRPWGIPLEGWVLGLAAAAALLLVLPIWRQGAPEGGTVDLPTNELSPAAVERPRIEAPIVASPPVGKDLASEPVKIRPPDSVGAGKDGSKVIGRATTGEDSIPKDAIEVASKEGSKKLELKGTGKELPPIGGKEPIASGTAEAPSTVPDPAAFQYVVRSEDAGMKREILALAGRYGTGATDLQDKPITDGKMRSGTEDLVVSIAPTDLPSFARDLAAKGYVVETHNPEDTLVGATVEVRITLQLVGGAPAVTEEVPNARAMELDEERAGPAD